MSDPNVSGSTPNAASEPGSQQSTREVAHHATTAAHQAPYYRYEKYRIPGVYVVQFKAGHTIAKHFAFLGRKFDLTPLDNGYFANMDDELLDAMRCDPGVDQQFTREVAQRTTTNTYQAPYYPDEENRVPGSYIVQFNIGHTIAKHFASLGREFDLKPLDEGYYANLDDQLLNAVRRDPGIEYVEDNVSGVPFSEDDNRITYEPDDHNVTTAYQARYYHFEEDVVPGVYIIQFHPGYTIAKHFEFLGLEFDVTMLDKGYFANLNAQLFEAVRSDPGVEYIEDDTTGKWDTLERHATTDAYQASYHHHDGHAVPGVYMVKFHLGHTITKHFAFLGREFDLTSLGEGYYANLDDQLFDAVRRDPGVEFIEDDVVGERDDLVDESDG